MMVLAFIYLAMPIMTNRTWFKTWRVNWSFWVMLGSFLLMVPILAGAGLIQTYYLRIAGLPFMTVRDQYLASWLSWRFIVAWFFAAGLILLVWLSGYRAGRQEEMQDRRNQRLECGGTL